MFGSVLAEELGGLFEMGLGLYWPVDFTADEGPGHVIGLGPGLVTDPDAELSIDPIPCLAQEFGIELVTDIGIDYLGHLWVHVWGNE